MIGWEIAPRPFGLQLRSNSAQLLLKNCISASQVYGAFPRSFRLLDLYSTWREVPAYAVYSIRLTLDPDAEPISFRPLLFLMKLFS